MNAEQYYTRNVLLHGQSLPQVQLHDYVRLPRVPSEADYALFWLSRENISGAILDVGCAGLDLLIKAQRMFRERCGVDIVPLPAWEKYPDIKASTCNLDNGNLPFADETFNAVTCLMVLEHVFDPFHGVRELRRVCKPNGRVVIGVPNIAGPKRRLELLVGKLPITSARFSFGEDAWDGYHLHNFTKNTLDWLLRREGLRPICWAAQGKFSSLKQLRPSLFGNDLIVLAEKTTPDRDCPFPF
jgi:2-polyprenyl-3-methyl-5-hydroxy-6-metoxy-1,4-benzoquinol methylase